MAQLFLQNVIAIVWDFDKTLIPGYMQTPLFRHYGVDQLKFWEEVNHLPEEYRRRGADRTSKDTVYLNHILAYVKAGIFRTLSNRRLQEFGGQLEFYPGMPAALGSLKQLVRDEERYRRHEITVEHYVVSTGLRAMIDGTGVMEYVDDVWACEFVEGTPGPGYLAQTQLELVGTEPVITDIAYAIDNTSKTRAVFEINKGTNKIAEIDVNAAIAPQDRRVPFQNMIYVADGPSDIPVFSIISQYGGKTFAVYKAKSEKDFRQANSLQEQGRVRAFGEADYNPGSHTFLWLTTTVREIADRICDDREIAVGEKTGRPPTHILEQPQPGSGSSAHAAAQGTKGNGESSLRLDFG